jgi:hypothetical protein
MFFIFLLIVILLLSVPVVGYPEHSKRTAMSWGKNAAAAPVRSFFSPGCDRRRALPTAARRKATGS